MFLFWACGVKAASHIRGNGAGKVLERIGDAERRQKGALIILRKKKKKRGPALGKAASDKFGLLLLIISD